MTLKFTCPNSHPISCDDGLSGRPAKCPRCGVKFVVPAPGQERAEPLSARSQAAADVAATTDTEGGTATATRTDVIVFLCPNGHKLNGPASLQGKPGKCPHCGERFRIPSYDETEAEQDEQVDEDEIRQGEVVGDDEVVDVRDLEQIEIVDDAPSDAPNFDMIAPPESVPDFQQGYVDDQAIVAEEVPDADMVADYLPAMAGGNGLADIFAMLWQHREYGGRIEMQLKEGELLTPDFYAPELSAGSHGVFAVKGKDGTFTITSIPWDAVLRVSLRKTEDLLPGYFQE